MLVRTRQREGSGRSPIRPLKTMLDRRWTEPLPILAWAIEHPEACGSPSRPTRRSDAGRRLMLAGAVDGVAPDPAVARDTIERIRRFAHDERVVYLPAHDPDAAARLAERRPAAA